MLFRSVVAKHTSPAPVPLFFLPKWNLKVYDIYTKVYIYQSKGYAIKTWYFQNTMIDFQCASSCKRLEINFTTTIYDTTYWSNMSVFVNVLKPKLKSGFLSLKEPVFKEKCNCQIQNRALTPCKQDWSHDQQTKCSSWELICDIIKFILNLHDL